jgi:Fic family protein
MAVQYHYGAFPPEELDWKRLIPVIGPASMAVARYDGTLSAVQNANLLLSPLVTQEAVLSSRIEGTQTTMGEVLEYEAEGASKIMEPEKRADIQEVLNYRQAMWTAVEMMKELPLCQRIVREAHRVLMDGVRGDKKAPGEYRRTQNWIGSHGSPIEAARFVPISPEQLANGMTAWEKHIHADAQDHLVRLAVLHAEFEALHPFHDGNGRLGRMLVPLYMAEKKLLSGPMFYISAYFEAHRDEYYDRLLDVSRAGKWTEWCLFFLEAVRDQAEQNQRKANAILSLYEDMKPRMTEITRSQYAISALDRIFANPIFNSSDFIERSGIPEATARRILRELRDHGVLGVVLEASGRRSAILAFPDLLNITEG